MPYKVEYPTAQELTNALGGQWNKTRGDGKAKCPAHDDANPSLDIAQRGDHTVVICRAGCEQNAVLDALRAQGHWPEAKAKRGNGHANGKHGGGDNILATYSYQLEDGKEHYQVVRLAPKNFRVRRSNGNDGWKWQRPLMRWRLPYRLPEVLEAIASGHTVFVVEGEKDADNLANLNIVATCNAGGAGKWTAEHATYFKGADLVIVPDNDDAGRNHAQQVAKSVGGIATRVRMLELPGLPLKGDVSDWIDKNGTDTAKQLWTLVETTATEVKGPKAAKAAGKPPTASTDDPAHWNVEPWPESVAIAEVLDAICAILVRHIVLPKHAAEAIALWVLHAWTIDAWGHSPLLIVVSPTKQCGKTTLLSILLWLLPRSELISNATASPIFRLIEDAKPAVPTFLLDEGDSYLKPDKEDLRGILNSGWMRLGASVIRADKVDGAHKARRFSTWAPKVIGTIRAVADTLMDRGIIVTMQRKAKGQKVDRFRMRDAIEFRQLRQKCMRWAADMVPTLAEADPQVPQELSNRPADNWRALLAIADAAGGTWPDKAQAAALALSNVPVDDDRNVELLRDIRRVFEETGADHLGAEVLVNYLAGLPDTPWAEYRPGDKPITSRGVWRLLKTFGIRSRHDRNANRYYREDFKEAFASYLGEP
jgi:putative DNA primase/helicase